MEANNKALREAVSELLSEIGKYTQDGLEVIWIGIKGNTICRLKSALAEPVKNCEVGTAEAQMKRQRDTMCNTTNACPDPDMSCRECFARWAQMPYNEEGGAK